MDIYNLGPDDLGDDSIREAMVGRNFAAKWVVDHYTIDGYEGSGSLLAYDGSRLLAYAYGHCSCYGPLDAIGEASEISVADLFAGSDSIHAAVNDVNESVLTKARELVLAELRLKCPLIDAEDGIVADWMEDNDMAEASAMLRRGLVKV